MFSDPDSVRMFILTRDLTACIYLLETCNVDFDSPYRNRLFIMDNIT